MWRIACVLRVAYCVRRRTARDSNNKTRSRYNHVSVPSFLVPLLRSSHLSTIHATSTYVCDSPSFHSPLLPFFFPLAILNLFVNLHVTYLASPSRGWLLLLSPPPFKLFFSCNNKHYFVNYNAPAGNVAYIWPALWLSPSIRGWKLSSGCCTCWWR